jgi:hypothetical protein
MSQSLGRKLDSISKLKQVESSSRSIRRNIYVTTATLLWFDSAFIRACHRHSIKIRRVAALEQPGRPVNTLGFGPFLLMLLTSGNIPAP